MPVESLPGAVIEPGACMQPSSMASNSISPSSVVLGPSLTEDRDVSAVHLCGGPDAVIVEVSSDLLGASAGSLSSGLPRAVLSLPAQSKSKVSRIG